MVDTSNFSRRTICFPYIDDKILLGMKLEGFGSGKYNGFGGKFDTLKNDKVMTDTAIRELREESLLIAESSDLEKRAVIDFVFPASPSHNQRVHIYFLSKWQGSPERTEEMSPEWFHINNIPYHKMWDSDKLWLPEILQGKIFYALFYWKEDNETVDNYEIILDAKLDDW